MHRTGRFLSMLAAALVPFGAASAEDDPDGGVRQSLGTRAALAAANLPNFHFAGEVREGIGFGSHGLSLDAYIPETGQARPVALFFHGGSWRMGEREQYGFAGIALAEAGFLAVVPDYRKHPKVVFPAFMEDAAEAVRWARDNAARMGGDPDRILLVGHSAGGHIAALLAYDGRYLEAAGVDPGVIVGVAGLAGPYDFTPQAANIRAVFASPENYPAMQAGNFVEPGDPPILMQIGADDRIVSTSNMDRMEEALDAAGVCFARRRYPGLDHIGIAAELTAYYRDESPVMADLARFLGAAARGEACGFEP